jgi:hypothetical protein
MGVPSPTVKEAEAPSPLPALALEKLGLHKDCFERVARKVKHDRHDSLQRSSGMGATQTRGTVQPLQASGLPCLPQPEL